MGYRRVRQVTNWVLVPDDVRSEVLLKTKVGETQSEGEVEGVVYNVSSTSEAYRLEKHAQAEYGIGSYTTVNVQIEVLAQGNRRARKIEGRTIIYTGGSNYLGKDIKPRRETAGEEAFAHQGEAAAAAMYDGDRKAAATFTVFELHVRYATPGSHGRCKTSTAITLVEPRVCGAAACFISGCFH